ncbi:hypothetical protein ACWDRR_08915 [Kitasatospora sp. NPDC003701]
MTAGLALAGIALSGLTVSGIRLWRDVLVLRSLERLTADCTARQRTEIGRVLAESIGSAAPPRLDRAIGTTEQAGR